MIERYQPGQNRAMYRSADPEDGASPAVDPVQRTYDTTLTVEVDGELFAVSVGTDGDNDYVWLTGPNPGYGFGESGPFERSLVDHRAAIRNFLDQIDPETGYIEE